MILYLTVSAFILLFFIMYNSKKKSLSLKNIIIIDLTAFIIFIIAGVLFPVLIFNELISDLSLPYVYVMGLSYFIVRILYIEIFILKKYSCKLDILIILVLIHLIVMTLIGQWNKIRHFDPFIAGGIWIVLTAVTLVLFILAVREMKVDTSPDKIDYLLVKSITATGFVYLPLVVIYHSYSYAGEIFYSYHCSMMTGNLIWTFRYSMSFLALTWVIFFLYLLIRLGIYAIINKIVKGAV